MGNEKVIPSRIQLKHDTEDNWNNSNFIAKIGEPIIYDSDENHNYPRVKIGDGILSVNDLKFIDEIASNHVANDDIHVTLEEKETWSNIVDGYATESYVNNLYTKLSSNTVLGFYCIEDVTIVTNGVSEVYPANSNVKITFGKDDTFEIIPTSNASILSLNAFPAALGTFYPWLEGVA